MNKIIDSLELMAFEESGFYIQKNQILSYLSADSISSSDVEGKKILWLNTFGWSQKYRLDYSIWSKFEYLYITSTGYVLDLEYQRKFFEKEIRECRTIESKQEKIDSSTTYLKITLPSLFCKMKLNANLTRNDLVISTVYLADSSYLSIDQFQLWFFDIFIKLFSVTNIELIKTLDLALNSIFPIENWRIYTDQSLKVVELVSIVNRWNDHTDEVRKLISLINNRDSDWVFKCKKGLIEN